MVQRTDKPGDSQQPLPVLDGLIDPKLLSMPASEPDMAADNNNLGHLRPQHAQADQNLEAPSGPVHPTGPMVYQQFENSFAHGHHPNQVVPMGYGQFAGMIENESPMHEYISPGWMNPQPMVHQAGCPMGYGVYNMNMDPMAQGGLKNADSSTMPTIANRGTHPKEHQARRRKKAKRWTPQMDARPDSLKASHETHEAIAQILEAEFPSAEGLEPLNHNIVTKRLKELRETAGAPSAIDICVNGFVPKALPVLKDAIARMTGSDGLGDLESEMAEVELELRGQAKKILQNMMLRRKRAKEAAAAAGSAASHAPTRVMKPTGRSGGRARDA